MGVGTQCCPNPYDGEHYNDDDDDDDGDLVHSGNDNAMFIDDDDMGDGDVG